MKKTLYYFFIVAFLMIGCSEDDGPVELANEAPEEQSCGATSDLIGQSRALRVSNTYGISGTVTILSDCEVEISNFFYNGLGPNVSIYGGVNGDFVNGVNLTSPINGIVFEDETIRFFLPEGSTVDEINSFSVWCFEFDIDFSSASFQ